MSRSKVENLKKSLRLILRNRRWLKSMWNIVCTREVSVSWKCLKKHRPWVSRMYLLVYNSGLSEVSGSPSKEKGWRVTTNHLGWPGGIGISSLMSISRQWDGVLWYRYRCGDSFGSVGPGDGTMYGNEGFCIHTGPAVAEATDMRPFLQDEPLVYSPNESTLKPRNFLDTYEQRVKSGMGCLDRSCHIFCFVLQEMFFLIQRKWQTKRYRKFKQGEDPFRVLERSCFTLVTQSYLDLNCAYSGNKRRSGRTNNHYVWPL